MNTINMININGETYTLGIGEQRAQELIDIADQQVVECQRLKDATAADKISVDNMASDVEELVSQARGAADQANTYAGVANERANEATASADELREMIENLEENTFAPIVHRHNVEDLNNPEKLFQDMGIQAMAFKASVDAGTDITSGTLPIERGGTGATTAQEAINVLMQGVAASSATLIDTDSIISTYHASGASDDTRYRRRTALNLWNYISGKMGAHVADANTSDNWRYIKWSNGFAVCWKKVSDAGTAITSASGQMFRSDTLTKNFPFTFSANPTLLLIPRYGAQVAYQYSNNTSQASYRYLCTTSNASPSTLEVNIVAFGTYTV